MLKNIHWADNFLRLWSFGLATPQKFSTWLILFPWWNIMCSDCTSIFQITYLQQTFCSMPKMTNNIMNTYCGWTSNWTMLDGSSSLDFTGLIQNSGMNTRRCGSPFQYKGYFGMARFHNGLQMKIWNLLKLHWSSKQGKYILQDKYMSIKYDINIWHS